MSDKNIEVNFGGRGIEGSLAETFERKNGSIPFIKAVLSALTRILVTKGICTEDELLKTFESEVIEGEKQKGACV